MLEKTVRDHYSEIGALPLSLVHLGKLLHQTHGSKYEPYKIQCASLHQAVLKSEAKVVCGYFNGNENDYQIVTLPELNEGDARLIKTEIIPFVNGLFEKIEKNQNSSKDKSYQGPSSQYSYKKVNEMNLDVLKQSMQFIHSQFDCESHQELINRFCYSSFYVKSNVRNVKTIYKRNEIDFEGAGEDLAEPGFVLLTETLTENDIARNKNNHSENGVENRKAWIRAQVCFAYHPELLYIQKFGLQGITKDRLQRMQLDLTARLEERDAKLKVPLPKSWLEDTKNERIYCVYREVKSNEIVYYRAYSCSALEKGKLSIYLLDYGEVINSVSFNTLFCLPLVFTGLKAQAIPMAIAGIKALVGAQTGEAKTWSVESCDHLKNLMNTKSQKRHGVAIGITEGYRNKVFQEDYQRVCQKKWDSRRKLENCVDVLTGVKNVEKLVHFKGNFWLINGEEGEISDEGNFMKNLQEKGLCEVRLEYNTDWDRIDEQSDFIRVKRVNVKVAGLKFDLIFLIHAGCLYLVKQCLEMILKHTEATGSDGMKLSGEHENMKIRKSVEPKDCFLVLDDNMNHVMKQHIEDRYKYKLDDLVSIKICEWEVDTKTETDFGTLLKVLNNIGVKELEFCEKLIKHAITEIGKTEINTGL